MPLGARPVVNFRAGAARRARKMSGVPPQETRRRFLGVRRKKPPLKKMRGAPGEEGAAPAAGKFYRSAVAAAKTFRYSGKKIPPFPLREGRESFLA